MVIAHQPKLQAKSISPVALTSGLTSATKDHSLRRSSSLRREAPIVGRSTLAGELSAIPDGSLPLLRIEGSIEGRRKDGEPAGGFGGPWPEADHCMHFGGRKHAMRMCDLRIEYDRTRITP